MKLRDVIKASLASLGYTIQRVRRPGGAVQGLDWAADVRALLGSRPNLTVFDVGANTGQTAIALARLFPRADIYSFEPFKDSFERLQANVRHLPRVKPVNAALGEAKMTKELFVNADSQANSLLRNSPLASEAYPGRGMQPKAATPVSVYTLDEFCRIEGIARIDLLKMDAQGYELRILEGGVALLRAQAVHLVYSEVLFAALYEGQAYFHEVYQRLLGFDYALVGLYGNAYSEDNRLLWADALFAPRAMAI